MKKFGVLVATLLVGIGVAVTYHVFENLVHMSIDAIWYDWLNTDSVRWLIIPLCVIVTLLFIGLQHLLDAKSENKEEHGLGDAPKPTLTNYINVLVIGFFSLLAGASLGPEAILVPASMILGGFVGAKLFSKQPELTKLLAAAGIMALFTAFFHSFLVGVLSILLVTKQAKIKVSPVLFVVAVLASASSFFALKVLDGNSYVDFPAVSWHINTTTILGCAALLLAGYVAIMAMAGVHDLFEKARKQMKKQSWVARGLVASFGLSILYLVGGPLVEFTGNRSIQPMFEQSASLGLWGLLGILVVKIMAIAWSKALGYRGGMIFPTIFVVSVLIAIVQLYNNDFNYVYGLIAALVGAFAANKKSGILV